MAKIIPFRGVMYNKDEINDLSAIVTPPFDVISEEDQCYFHECHPQNVIRLILGRKTENDSDDNNCHTRAADCFNEWLSEDILVQDHSPAFYLTSLEFPLEDRTMIRFGLIALVGLEPFKKGIILPHEKTFSKVRSERLELMKACNTNFSPIFSLYSDQKNILSTLREAVSGKTPDMAFADNKGHKHRLWRITNPAVHEYISKSMKGKKIFIADGHHRYETALNYRNWVKANIADFSAKHPANYVMMYLSSMEDTGMIILPAHRMLKGIQKSVITGFVRKAKKYFKIKTIPLGESAAAELVSAMKSDSSENRIGVSMKNARGLYLLTLKPDIMDKMFKDKLPDALRNIDVTVLTRLIFMKILGFDQARLDNEKMIAYSSIAEEAIDAVALGKCDMSFILNPTRIEQVQEIAQKGLIMPRKATYFYPKVIVGQVMNILE